MEKKEVISSEFARSVIFGYTKVLYHWLGIGMRSMTNHVGMDFIVPHLKFPVDNKEEMLDSISEMLAKEHKVCESAQIKIDEKEGVMHISVKNCCLLPLEKRIREELKLTNFVVCPVVNAVSEAMNRAGVEVEKRSYKIEGEKCQHILGLIDELAMEKEIKKEEEP
jgi:hypothetical protein